MLCEMNTRDAETLNSYSLLKELIILIATAFIITSRCVPVLFQQSIRMQEARELLFMVRNVLRRRTFIQAQARSFVLKLSRQYKNIYTAAIFRRFRNWKLQKCAHQLPHACLSAYHNSRTNKQIFAKFYVREFCVNLLTLCNFG